MRLVLLPLLSLLLLVALPACMLQNISTGQKFREMVDGVNEEARWNRLDLASTRVHPSYRAAYRMSHREWGDDIQIADSEVTDLQIQDDQDTAQSVVTVSWYRYDTMTLHATRLQQSWERMDGRFLLAGEEVVDGEASLLADPPEAEEDARLSKGE